MLRRLRNIMLSDNSLLREGLMELRRRLPPGWRASEPKREVSRAAADVTIEISPPTNAQGWSSWKPGHGSSQRV